MVNMRLSAYAAHQLHVTEYKVVKILPFRKLVYNKKTRARFNGQKRHKLSSQDTASSMLQGI